ncbi:MAG: hypothetical protein C4519_08745 [Desulfobacteraceae bacterium]|nr:MAG: hypothetical protein C4519_08745 [Desulfobacteraceae bacterium]
MLSRLKQYILIGLLIGAFYFLLSHHLIFTSLTSFDLLKKREPTLKYTFFSLKQATPEAALRIEELREVGLGELMVEKGMLTQEKLNAILRKYND